MFAFGGILLVFVLAGGLAPDKVLVSCFEDLSFPGFGGFSPLKSFGMFDDGRDNDMNNLKNEGITFEAVQSIASNFDILGKKGTANKGRKAEGNSNYQPTDTESSSD